MATTAGRKRTMRIRRHVRVRKHIAGTTARPRLAVFRSGRHISAQVIDDSVGRTLASASTVEASLRGATGGNVAAATAVLQSTLREVLRENLGQTYGVSVGLSCSRR